MPCLRRVSKGREPREKVYLAFEGIATEPQYFEWLIENEDRNINVEILHLYRGPGMIGASNPKKIADMVCDYVVWMYDNKYSVNLFIEQVLNNVEKRTGNKCSGKDFSELKHAITHSKFADERTIKDEDGALEICREIIGDSAVLDSHPPGGPPKDANFFIIVDRDPSSFTREQCHYVENKCNEKGIGLIVSNPCFELWLLLHFDVTKEEILKDTSPKALKAYLQDKIKEHGDFDSTNCYRIGQARDRLKNERYCEGLVDLLSEDDCNESNIGTNIGMLMDIIFKGHYPHR